MKKIVIIGVIVLFVGVGFTMINNQFVSAGNTLQLLSNVIQEQPMQPGNYTNNIRCNYEGCHDQFPQPWIEVNKMDETPSSVTYTVDGQTDTWPWNEGWAVLDDLENNLENGLGPGEFTIAKSENNETYRVFWVDANDDLFGRGGANFTDINVPPSTNKSPSPPDIDGPTSGYPGRILKYQIVSTDNEGDEIWYFIDWGDGTFEDWFGPYASGEVQTVSHSWSNSGNYTIKAKAMDEHGAVSDWGYLTVTIPRNKSTNNMLLLRMFESFPILQKLLYLIK